MILFVKVHWLAKQGLAESIFKADIEFLTLFSIYKLMKKKRRVIGCVVKC